MGKKASVWLLSVVLAVIYLIVVLTVGYDGLVTAYVALAFLGSAVLLATRYLVKQEASVTLRGVGVGFALRAAGHALNVAEDNLVGYPSGQFVTEPGETTDSIVAREFRPRSSHRLVLSIMMIPWAVTGSVVAFFTALTSNALVWMVGQFIRVMTFVYFVFMFIVPLALALVAELVLKRFVASVITVHATEGENEVHLAFTFQGVSALLAKARLLKSFEVPVLPAKYHTPAMARAAAAAAPAGSAA